MGPGMRYSSLVTFQLMMFFFCFWMLSLLLDPVPSPPPVAPYRIGDDPLDLGIGVQPPAVVPAAPLHVWRDEVVGLGIEPALTSGSGAGFRVHGVGFRVNQGYEHRSGTRAQGSAPLGRMARRGCWAWH